MPTISADWFKNSRSSSTTPPDLSDAQAARVGAVLDMNQKGVFGKKISRALTASFTEEGEGSLTQAQATAVISIYKRFLEEDGGQQRQPLKVKAIRLSALFESIPHEVPTNFHKIKTIAMLRKMLDPDGVCGEDVRDTGKLREGAVACSAIFSNVAGELIYQ